MRLFLHLAWTEACALGRVCGVWVLALHLLLPVLAWLQEPAFLRFGALGMVETAALGSAAGAALGVPFVWALARMGGSSRSGYGAPPVSYGIAVATGIALFLCANLLAAMGLLLILGRPLDPGALPPLLVAVATAGCLWVLPLALLLPWFVALRAPIWVRGTLILVLSAALAVGFCPNPAETFAHPGAKMGGLLLACAGSLLLLALAQPTRVLSESFHAHRHPR